MISLGEFVDKYDALMLDPRMEEIYSDGDFFNVGYWLADTPNQRAACENLVTRLLVDVPVSSAQVLDAGCGCGGTTASVKRHLPQAAVTGINVSSRQLQRCRSTVPECHFARMDAANLAFSDDCFDCVISVEAAFHFHTRERFLREASRVLTNGGYLVLSDILFSSTRWVGDWMVPRENQIDSLEAYRTLLETSGFENIKFSDATTEAWNSFCLACMKCTREQYNAAALDNASFKVQMSYFEGLLNDSLGHYLLITAQKGKIVSNHASDLTATFMRVRS